MGVLVCRVQWWACHFDLTEAMVGVRFDLWVEGARLALHTLWAAQRRQHRTIFDPVVGFSIGGEAGPRKLSPN